MSYWRLRVAKTVELYLFPSLSCRSAEGLQLSRKWQATDISIACSARHALSGEIAAFVPVWETECAFKWLDVAYQERALGSTEPEDRLPARFLAHRSSSHRAGETSGSPVIVIQEPRFQNSSGEAGRGRWCPFVECGIELIFVFVGSLVLSRRLCSLVESDGLTGD
jgi:hypothetical protein